MGNFSPINQEEILRDGNSTFHIDATGQTAKKLDCASKRVLIYNIVLHITKQKIILTIAEAILSRHTTFHIESFLAFYPQ